MKHASSTDLERDRFFNAYPYLIIGFSLTVFCVPAFFILPSGDDWSTSQPIYVFTLDLLRPHTFWRPFEELLLVVVGWNAAWHPGLLHLAAILGHAASTLLIFWIAKIVTGSSKKSVVAAVLFAVFPSNAAAVWSVDSAIQTFSTSFGLLALYILVSYRSLSSVLLAGACCLVAALWKESGIAWLVAAPAFAAVVKDLKFANSSFPVYRNLLFQLVVALLLLAIYFFLRGVLALDHAFGPGSGRYALQMNPWLWLESSIMLLGIAITATDTIALFKDENYIVAALSFLITIPLLIWLLLTARGSSKKHLSLIALALAALLSPHVVIGQVSEMYAHPVTAGAIVSTLLIINTKPVDNKLVPVIVSLTIVLASFVSAHKWFEMHETGLRAAAVANRIEAHYEVGGFPGVVCTIQDKTNSGRPYSVLYMDAPIASGYGRSVLPRSGWELPYQISRAPDVVSCPKNAEDIWYITLDGDVLFLGDQ